MHRPSMTTRIPVFALFVLLLVTWPATGHPTPTDEAMFCGGTAPETTTCSTGTHTDTAGVMLEPGVRWDSAFQSDPDDENAPAASIASEAIGEDGTVVAGLYCTFADEDSATCTAYPDDSSIDCRASCAVWVLWVPVVELGVLPPFTYTHDCNVVGDGKWDCFTDHT